MSLNGLTCFSLQYNLKNKAEARQDLPLQKRVLRKREKAASPTSALLVHAHAPWILYGFPIRFFCSYSLFVSPHPREI